MFLRKTPAFPPILATERLILRPIVPGDAEQIYEYASDPEVTRYLPWDTHRSLRDTWAYIRATQAAYRRGQHYDYAITLRQSGRLIGAGGCVRELTEESRCAEIGYVLNRSYWGRGIATEAMHAVLRFLFETKSIHRIEARHAVQNESSGRVLQKLGMRLEGTLQDKYFFKGRYWTVRQYAILNPRAPQSPTPAAVAFVRHP